MILVLRPFLILVSAFLQPDVVARTLEVMVENRARCIANFILEMIASGEVTGGDEFLQAGDTRR